MSAVYKFEELFPDEEAQAPVPAAASVASRLIDRLEAKLGELTAAGYRIQWIEVSQKDLVTLFVEGGDQAILMDPDPDSDRAWYGEFEVRPSPKDFVWIYIEGEFEQMSAHIIS